MCHLEEHNARSSICGRAHYRLFVKLACESDQVVRLNVRQTKPSRPLYAEDTITDSVNSIGRPRSHYARIMMLLLDARTAKSSSQLLLEVGDSKGSADCIAGLEVCIFKGLNVDGIRRKGWQCLRVGIWHPNL